MTPEGVDGKARVWNRDAADMWPAVRNVAERGRRQLMGSRPAPVGFKGTQSMAAHIGDKE